MKKDLKLLFKPYGPKGLVVNLGDSIKEETHLKVKYLYERLRKNAHNGITAVIPSYCEVTIMFEPKQISLSGLKELCEKISYSFQDLMVSSRLVEIPVCYDDSLALDLEHVLHHTGLSKKELIKFHSSNEYLVYMLGFVPGFLYLGGMDERIETPRKETPRLKVDKGSVGIADGQTGIYPMEIPGGWQIIGKTPIDLLTDNIEDQIQMGDRVKFYSISLKEFKNWN